MFLFRLMSFSNSSAETFTRAKRETMKVLLAKEEERRSEMYAPSPPMAPPTVTTLATPMMIPSSVSTDRSLWFQIESSAMRNASQIMADTRLFFPPSGKSITSVSLPARDAAGHSP